jgi:HEAT repeat protein
VIRCLLTSASNIKLYPPESKTITRSIEDLKKALNGIFIKHSAFNLARIGDGLLVNGVKIDTADFETAAESFLKLMEKIGLNSITFLNNISSQDLKTFIAEIGSPVNKELNGEFWRSFAREQKISSIIFDQYFYGIVEDNIAISGIQTSHTEEKVKGTEANLIKPTSLGQKVQKGKMLELPLKEEDEVQLTEDFLISTAQQLNDLFLKGEKKKSCQLIDRLFQNFTKQTLQIRIKIIHICLNLLKNLVNTSQSWVVEQITNPLKVVLAKKQHPNLFKEISVLLTQTTANLIRFGDYQCATQIYVHLFGRLQQLKDSKDYQTQHLKMALMQELGEETQEILLDDLKSQDSSRQKQAIRFLGSIGPAASQFLIETIKTEDDLKVRQIASHLLKNSGPEAVESIKRELVLTGFADERLRILEIIANITEDIETELAYALGDENPKVRHAAFRLVERMNNEELTSLLLEYADHEDSSMAVAAIKSLGKLKPEGAIELLVSLIDSVKETERLIACCRALGKIADPATIELLAKLMVPGSFFTFRKRKSSMVRATAAFALTQIPHHRVGEVLFLYLEDRDPRVRRSAQNYFKTIKPSSPDVDN